MKRIFPVIVVLICLSVLGIMFIQMSWIDNAIHLKREQLQKQIDNSLSETKDLMHSRFLSKMGNIPIDADSRQYALIRYFTAQKFSDDEIREMIEKSLRKNNIKQPYEYCITNIFKNPIYKSEGFHIKNLQSAYSERITMEGTNKLTPTYQETLYLTFKEDRNYIIKQMGWMIIASIVFTTIIILAFVLTIRTLFRQKKLSEIKSDFINNMTHELKTPLATISLAIDALVNDKVIRDTDKIRYYSGLIKEENRRMNKQVEKILQSARLERQDIKLNLQVLDAHDVIRKVTDNLMLQIQEKHGAIELKLYAAKHSIEADEVHFSNIIFNLLDNAIKYSENQLYITLETQVLNNDMLAIKVSDKGIGMTKETQARVFEKFYRAHTGNIHNVKGFGLGLSYVKALVDAHGGKVKVESILGKGSTFTVQLPLQK